MRTSKTESLGTILSTNLPKNPPTVSPFESRCSECGAETDPIVVFGRKVKVPVCDSCKGIVVGRERLGHIRENRISERRLLSDVVDRQLPEKFRKAHLRDLSQKLRKAFLGLPRDKGVLLYGAPGLGKTHSMCAFMRYFLVRGRKAERISYDALCVKIRDTFKPSSARSEQDLIEHYQGIDKLFIEDVGTTVGDMGQESDFSLRTFLLILDHRIEHCKQTFITTNKSPDELGKSFDERVASRLHEACVIIPVGGNDKRKVKK